MVGLIKRLKPKSEFSCNLLTLMTGTTIAQTLNGNNKILNFTQVMMISIKIDNLINKFQGLYKYKLRKVVKMVGVL